MTIFLFSKKRTVGGEVVGGDMAVPNSISSKVFFFFFAYFIINKKKTSRYNRKRIGNASVRGSFLNKNITSQ